ncbi:hypothetical protein ACL02U_11935 [Streptomyces sp. MS06]|uniref:hypothetical protein n=1 Tax=Streptomyces sp. MS06 TaxID=3385974 RepID=UPI0039A3578C
MTDKPAAFEPADDSNTHPKAAPNAALQERIAKAARTVRLRLGPNAAAMAQHGDPIILNMSEADDLATAVLAELAPELDRLADLEHRLTWHTTCASCARLLDANIRETERAERAEARAQQAEATLDAESRTLNEVDQRCDGYASALTRIRETADWIRRNYPGLRSVHERLATALDQSSHHYTARPVTPEIERAATNRANQAAAESARTTAWLAKTGGIIGGTAAPEGSCSPGGEETKPNTEEQP